MRVAALLEALPKIGKANATQIMTKLDIADNRRVASLGARQRTALIERFAN